jgi:hypothetical protein
MRTETSTTLSKTNNGSVLSNCPSNPDSGIDHQVTFYGGQFGCTGTPPMDQRTITYRTKARASHYYGVYPDAIMRLERYGRDGRS